MRLQPNLDWKLFLEVNKLCQKDLAEFLNISEPSVSSVLNGHSNLRESNYEKVLSNPNWDTSMLIQEHAVAKCDLSSKLSAAVLRAEKAEALCEKYLEIIDKLATYISNG